MSEEPKLMDNEMDERGRINRRRFLRGILITGAGVLAGCATQDFAQQPDAYLTPTPAQALKSPQAPAEETREVVAQGSISLDQFLQFSSLLTGVDHLDPALGRIYLASLQSGNGEGPTLADIYGAASSGSGSLPHDVEALSEAGFFDQEGMSAAADQIITLWYTGVYQLGDEEHVATFVDALAWKVLHFTKPPTICASFGFWSKEPQVEISPSIEFTPAPTQPAETGAGGG